MADENDVITDLNMDAATGNGEDTAPAAGIISQYVKDLSVENPNAPASYQWTGEPQIDVQFNIAARPIEGEVHEAELKITASAKTEQGTAYVVDLTYGALLGMRHLDDSQAHLFLYAEAPRIMFPFARRIIGDAVRDAGFTALMLDPIDFNALYFQQMQAKQQEQQAAGGQGGDFGGGTVGNA